MVKNVVEMTIEQSKDFNTLARIIKDLGGKGGCQACCSGKPLEFKLEGDRFEKEDTGTAYFRLDEQGNLIESK